MIDPLDFTTLRTARRYVDMTQKDLAAAVSLSQSTINELERGKHDPKLSNWVKIVSVIRSKLEEKGNA